MHLIYHGFLLTKWRPTGHHPASRLSTSRSQQVPNHLCSLRLRERSSWSPAGSALTRLARQREPGTGGEDGPAPEASLPLAASARGNPWSLRGDEGPGLPGRAWPRRTTGPEMCRQPREEAAASAAGPSVSAPPTAPADSVPAPSTALTGAAPGLQGGS